MQNKRCGSCGSQDTRIKEFEIRHVNSRTMKLNSSQKMKELVCRECDWHITLDTIPAFV